MLRNKSDYASKPEVSHPGGSGNRPAAAGQRSVPEGSDHRLPWRVDDIETRLSGEFVHRARSTWTCCSDLLGSEGG